MYRPRHSPYYYYLCCTPDIAVVGTIFNVFCFDAVSARDLNHHLPSNEQMNYLLSHDCGLSLIISNNMRVLWCKILFKERFYSNIGFLYCKTKKVNKTLNKSSQKWDSYSTPPLVLDISDERQLNCKTFVLQVLIEEAVPVYRSRYSYYIHYSCQGQENQRW